jgi:hypothetical protein
MSDYCLEPMLVEEINQLVGTDFVKNFQKEIDEMLAPLRKHLALGRPLSLGKETWEYAVADSIPGAEWAGAGNSIIDVRLSKDIGFDVKSVGKGAGNKSGEASMFQTYEGHTDSSFSNQDSALLWKTFVEGWAKKVKTVQDYYLLVIVKDKSYNCGMCGFKRVGEIPEFDPSFGTFLTETGRASKGTWTISQIADPNLLHTIVIKNKKRLEMRLRPAMHDDPKYCLPIYKFQ